MAPNHKFLNVKTKSRDKIHNFSLEALSSFCIETSSDFLRYIWLLRIDGVQLDKQCCFYFLCCSFSTGQTDKLIFVRSKLSWFLIFGQESDFLTRFPSRRVLFILEIFLFWKATLNWKKRNCYWIGSNSEEIFKRRLMVNSAQHKGKLLMNSDNHAQE